MKAKYLISIFFALTVMIFSSSCTSDEGFVEKSKITGKVTYTNGNAAGAIVGISFGATEATDAVDYSTVTGSDGSYSFEGLVKGNYFVNAVFTDANGFEYKSGGVAVEIGSNKSEVTADISLK
jgi:hypothetical protein